ncbi:hypothetical protein C1645_818222 [Glomus cerebriforme]|uniref:Uncharacterized protein n=1 Tax=Glomus cerebriforme TaxID=658196 RepID=A0A397TAD3_9GLOM|nr:hypothetical protein C1645_818222 [Glomus cerebriforme]
MRLKFLLLIFISFTFVSIFTNAFNGKRDADALPPDWKRDAVANEFKREAEANDIKRDADAHPHNWKRETEAQDVFKRDAGKYY